MLDSSPKATPIPGADRVCRMPSRLQQITQLIKRMLTVVAALDTAEAITLGDKRRILSAQPNAIHRENTGITAQVLDYPQAQKDVRQSSRTERLAS